MDTKTMDVNEAKLYAAYAAMSDLVEDEQAAAVLNDQQFLTCTDACSILFAILEEKS